MGPPPPKRARGGGGRAATAAGDALAAADAAPLAWLLAPSGVADFWDRVFERSHLLCKATPARCAAAASLFTRTDLARLAAGRARLRYGTDVVAARYTKDVRQTLAGGTCDSGGSGDGFLDAAALATAETEGATLQIHQPQRWCDGVWRLVAALERDLGCLVGANTYMTPAGSQGLAPHWDDVEVWVVQVEGAKRWRVYAPAPGTELPARPSGDLRQADLPSPALEVVLGVGDVLYLPRGTVHQAESLGSPSTHLTLSSYQRWALADLGAAALAAAAARGGRAGCARAPALPTLPRGLRAGLPPGLLYACGYEAAVRGMGGKKGKAGGPSAVPQAAATAKQLAAGLRALADVVDAAPSLLDAAADALADDFFASRAPPHPAQLPVLGPAPREGDSVACRGRGLFRLVCCEPEDAPGGDGDGFVKVASCLTNRREHHMAPPLESPAWPSGGSRSGDDTSSSSGGVREAGGKGKAAGNGRNRSRGRLGSAGGSVNHGNGASAGAGSADANADSSASNADEEDESDDDDGCGGTLYPAAYAPALAALLVATPDAPLAISAVPLPSAEERLGLAYALWSEGVIRTLPAGGGGGGGGAKRK